MTTGQRVTLGDIAELAQVRRPTASNWRRRHGTFPKAIGGPVTQPEFDAEQVAEWLDGRPLLEPVEGGPKNYGEVFRARLRLRALTVLRGAMDGDSIIRLAVALAALRTVDGALAVDRQKLSTQAAQLEAARPELRGVFTPVLTDLPTLAERLIPAVDQLCVAMGPAQAVELFLDSADQVGSSLRTFMTPPEVTELIALLVGELGGRSVCDPVAGTGGLLLRVLSSGGAGLVVAADIDEHARRMLRHRALCHGTDLQASSVDSLRDWPAPPSDVIVLDPPFVSGEFTSRAKTEQGPGPLDWIRTAVINLAQDGRAYVLVPAWMLTREIDERHWLAQRGVLRAVLQLPRRVQKFRTGTELALLVLGPRGGTSGAVLCDADKLAQRHGDTWPERAARAVHDPSSARHDECRTVPAPELTGSASWLPAHRLAPVAETVDHARQAIEAQQALHKRFGGESWTRELDVVATREDTGQRRLSDVAQLLGGHRIKTEDILERVPDSGHVPVIGADELRGLRPPRTRAIDILWALGKYEAVQRTEPGDVIVLAEGGVDTYVDQDGGSVVLFPAQIVRPFPDGVPSRLLARIISAPRNASRETGSTVRRVSLRAMVVPDLPVADMVALEVYLAELDQQRAALRAKLDAIDTLDRVVSAGIADGALRVVRAPR